MIRNAIRLLVVMALLLTSAVAFAQDETDTTNTAVPLVGIRFMEADNGVLVTGIITNTPAQMIGLQAGDIITSVNNDPIDSLNVQETVWNYSANDTVTLTVERNGRELKQDITLMARPDDLFDNPLYVLPMEPSSIGLVVSEFNGDLIVLGTVDGSQAQDAGFEANDIITRVDGDNVNSVGSAAIAMSDLNDGDTAEFNVTRGEENLVIRIVIDRRRRRPRPRPRDITSTYATEAVTLGYGDGFIEVEALTSTHDLYIAGLREGDAIVAINGDSIDNLNNLFASNTIDLTVERDAGVMYFNVPTSVAPLLMFGVDAPQTQDAGEWLGLHEKQVTLGVRYLQLEADSPYFTSDSVSNGAYIAEVIEGLPAAQAGIMVGDIITSIDGEPVTLEIDLRNRIYAHQAGDTVTLEVLRYGEIIQLDVTLRVATS
jgi:S1-C subfamily serine protease